MGLEDGHHLAQPLAHGHLLQPRHLVRVRGRVRGRARVRVRGRVRGRVRVGAERRRGGARIGEQHGLGAQQHRVA